jgi:hypothetical protein
VTEDDVIKLVSEHPVYGPKFTRAHFDAADRAGKKALKDYVDAFQDAAKLIQLEKADPFSYGYEPPHWGHADDLLKDCDELFISGGNRSGKTEYCAKRAVQTLLNKPGARVAVFHTTSQSSLQSQQPVVYKYIPAHLKKTKKGKVTNISYTQKGGFTFSTFVLPNASQCWCMNYAQDIRVLEGNELDLAWADEEVGADWLEAIRFRLVTRAGKLITSFTPVSGFTPTVKDLLSGHSVEWTQESELLPGENLPGIPKGHMPYVLNLRRKNSKAIFFFTAYNPYNPYSELKKRLDGANSRDIKIRAYGWAEATIGNQFPRFSEQHVVKEVPDGGMNFMVADPAGARNWFMLWGRAVAGKLYIYREWPDARTHGEWALPGGKHDGVPGPAQRAGAGRSIREYKELIEQIEDGEPIMARLIDPRAAENKSGDGVTPLDKLHTAGEGERAMPFFKASGNAIEQGVSLINDMLANNQLLVHEDCESLIYSLREWTGADKDKGATKDPIDCLRYLVQEDVLLINKAGMNKFAKKGCY